MTAQNAADARRLALLAGHVLNGAAVAPAARRRVFWRGVLAHLILVPSWTLSPALLLAALVQVGLPAGWKGVLAALGLGGGLVAAPSNRARGAFCLALAALAARVGSTASTLRSACAVAMVSMLAWMCGTGDFAQRPGLCDFISEWAKDFYAHTELRGALSSIRRGKSFFAFHPHGCLSAGWTINGTFNPAFARAAGRVVWLIDPALRHKNPFFRVLCDAYRREDRAIEAGDRQGLELQMSRGESVALIPGGFQDAVAFEHKREVTVLRNRKGFVKYCLQYGYRLHPVYTFGESETYYTFTGLRKLRMRVSEYNIPMVLFRGWRFFPALPLPESRILTYVGPGIDLPHIAQPTAEDVDHWHAVYLGALQCLFRTHRAEAGCAQAELEIL